MAFVQSFTASQSSDSKTITVTDTSNWVAESLSPSDFVRQIVVKDSDDNVINTYAFEGSNLTLSYPIAINQWQKLTYNITGAFSATLTQEYPFEQLFRLADAKKGSEDCGCCPDKSDCQIDDYYRGAELAIPIGNGIAYDKYITAAYALLTQ